MVWPFKWNLFRWLVHYASRTQDAGVTESLFGILKGQKHWNNNLIMLFVPFNFASMQKTPSIWENLKKAKWFELIL